MKRQNHPRTVKQVAAAILAVLTMLLCVMPASAANGIETDKQQENITGYLIDDSQLALFTDASAQSEPDAKSDDSASQTTQPPYAGENSEVSENSMDESSVSDPGDESSMGEDGEEPEEPEEPEPAVYTVTYFMSQFGKYTEEVEEDGLPAQIPETDIFAAVFLGWFTDDGTEVEPAELPVTADITYTARYERHLEDLLDTVNHTVYISGYGNGMLKPNAGITRAETASIFYTLLLDKDVEVKLFADVPAGKWYSNPIGVMASLGIVQGYKNGNFYPNQVITRAEFVKMAVSFDMLLQNKAQFSDVPGSHWATSYIATARDNGWIAGYKDGTFKPDAKISRAEAITIVNQMLGRYPAADIKSKADVKNFYDVYTTHWAYGQIAEASTAHTYEINRDTKTETWLTYEKDTAVVTSKWLVDENDRYYVDAKTKKFVRGEYTIDGKQYYFDPATGKAFTGFRYVGQWKRYYKQGLIQEDISKLGVVSGPYYIKVYKKSNYQIIYAKDGAKGYTIPVKAMINSCGNNTPTGTYYTPYRYRWLRMEGYTWAQWCTQIYGNYLFHSVPNWTYNNFDLEVYEYNLLGSTRSLGCIRLTCEDAKWIYDNCGLGTQVYISAVETSGPLSKPTSLKLASWHTWDPTDPTAYYMCQRRGCH